jgi:hypothetical protein
METKMTDTLLDAAACEALGASTAAESAGYQQQLAAGGDAARRIDRALRDTVARMAATSPYLEPPADLRGKILQATAPTTFRMEDYRKATRDNSRLYKWGFYAAALFLMAGAWFNITMQQKNAVLNNQVAQAKGRTQVLENTLAAFVNPSSMPINFVTNDETHKLWARAWVNEKTHEAIVILPKELSEPGKSVQLTLGGQQFQTTTLTGSAEMFPDKLPPGMTVPLAINVDQKNLSSTNTKVFNASQVP